MRVTCPTVFGVTFVIAWMCFGWLADFNDYTGLSQRVGFSFILAASVALLAALATPRLRRWIVSLCIAALIGVLSFRILVWNFRPMPLMGYYTGPWTNAQLIHDRWPFHIVPVPSAKADASADGTLVDWYFAEFRARMFSIPVVSICAFLLTFYAMRPRQPRQTI